MRLIVISLASWVSGYAAYVAALSVFWGQRMSPGDRNAVLFWSAVAATVAITCVHAPAMFALRGRLGPRSAARWWAYPAVGVSLGVVPVLLIVGMWSSSLAGVFSPEGALFFCMFGVFGAAFGIGFFLLYGRQPA